MSTKKTSKEKLTLHPRNRNRVPYDLQAMAAASPSLLPYIQPTKFGNDSINFSDPAAVRVLNSAILSYYYGIKNWVFPQENLSPPVPGRADYIHHIADLLAEDCDGNIPKGGNITCLDIGTGANCIYPIIGITEYQWNFIGTDIDAKSIATAQHIADINPSLKGKVVCKLQPDTIAIFEGVVKREDSIAATICNPPFHASIEEATAGTARKVRNLTGKKTTVPKPNFSGNSSELVYKGGELQFIANMVSESKTVAKNCCWFTTLVSKESNLKRVYKLIQKQRPTDSKTINLATGNKSSRIVAWTFLTSEERRRFLGTKG